MTMRRGWAWRAAWVVAGVTGVSASALGAPAARGPEVTNGHIIVSTRADGAIVLLHPETFKETARLLAPVGLHEIAASGDGRRAVGSAYGSGPRHATPDQRLLVINLPDLNEATDDVLSIGPLIDLGSSNPRPNDLVFFPDSTRVVVTSEVARTVLTVDLDVATAGAKPPPPPAQVPVSSEGIVGSVRFDERAGHMLAASADVSRVWVPGVVDGIVSVIDMEAGAVVARIETSAGAEGVAASPDGSEVWVACNRSERMFVLDARRDEVLGSFEARGFPFRVRFTPDSGRVVVTFPSAHEVRVFDAASRKVVRTVRLDEGSMPTSVAVSPDGRLAAVVCGGIASVVVFEIETGRVVAKVRVGVEADGLAWAPAPE